MKESPPRSFPSDMEKNLRECQAITLRSGKWIRDPKENEKEKVEDENEEAKVEKKEGNEKEKFSLERITFPDNPPLIIPPLPFPQRFRKAKLDK